jgi:hypothetical protein
VPEEEWQGRMSWGTPFCERCRIRQGSPKVGGKISRSRNAQERESWAINVGEEVVNPLYRAAEDAMPNYMYLRNLRPV